MNIDGPRGCHCHLGEGDPDEVEYTTIIFEDNGVRVLLRTLDDEEDNDAVDSNILALAIARRVREDTTWKEELIEEYMQHLSNTYMGNDT